MMTSHHSLFLQTRRALLLGALCMPLWAAGAPKGADRGEGPLPGRQAEGRSDVHPDMPPPSPLVGQLRRLNLDEGQKDAVFKLLHASMPAAHSQWKLASQALRSLHEAHRQGSYDAEKGAELVKAHGQAMQNIMLAQIELEAKIVALLSAEQRKTLAQLPRPERQGIGPRPPQAPLPQ